MANILKKHKQVAALSMLLEGSSVRATERVIGVHRDTILRLMVRVAGACADFSNRTLRDLNCGRIEVDEIWAFVAKKSKNVRDSDDWSRIGDQYTFVALDPETKLIPSYKVGKRTAYTTMEFIDDLAARLGRRVQISSDAFPAYYHAIATAFPNGVDYASVVKDYEETPAGRSRYSPPRVVRIEKDDLIGTPDLELASTSLVERSKPLDSNPLPTPDALESRLLQEVGELQGVDGSVFLLLQFRARAPDHPLHASPASRYRSVCAFHW